MPVARIPSRLGPADLAIKPFAGRDIEDRLGVTTACLWTPKLKRESIAQFYAPVSGPHSMPQYRIDSTLKKNQIHCPLVQTSNSAHPLCPSPHPSHFATMIPGVLGCRKSKRTCNSEARSRDRKNAIIRLEPAECMHPQQNVSNHVISLRGKLFFISFQLFLQFVSIKGF